MNRSSFNNTLLSVNPSLQRGLNTFTAFEKNVGKKFSPTYTPLPNYDDLITKGDNTTKLIARNGGLKVTIDTVKDAIKKYSYQVQNLAKHLSSYDRMQADYNVWHWVKTNILYSLDDPHTEQIRTPYASYRDGFIGKTRYRAAIAPRGVDCEDYTILVCSLLHCMGINAIPNIVAFNGRLNYQHIFPMEGNVVLDDVMPSFNTLPQNITKQMQVSLLNGIPETPIYGFGAIQPPDNITKKLMDQQTLLLKRIAQGDNNPVYLKELRKIRFAILLNGSEEREDILKHLADVEDITPDGHYVFKSNVVLDEGDDDWEDTYELDDLGKIRFGKFLKNIKNKVGGALRSAAQGVASAARSAGNFIKKVGGDLLKLGLAIPRAGVLLALKMNLARIASKMKYGYLSMDEAIRRRFDLGEWKKLTNSVRRNENLFQTLGGKKEDFKTAILKGGGGLSGLVHPLDVSPMTLEGIEEGFQGLGVLPLLAAGAAAAPFIMKIANAVKDVDFKHLFSKADKSPEEAAIAQPPAEAAVPASEANVSTALQEGFKNDEEKGLANKVMQYEQKRDLQMQASGPASYNMASPPAPSPSAPAAPAYSPPPESSAPSNTTKYIMIGGAVIAISGLALMMGKGKRR